LSTNSVNFKKIARSAGVASPPVLAVALIPFRTSFSDTEGALVMVVVIVAVAAFGDRLAGLLAAVSSGLWFDFFLTRPYERLTISHRHDIETTVLLFVVGVAVTELTARGRQHRQHATEQSRYLHELQAMARMMAEGAEPRIALSHVEATLSSLLRLRGCRYDPSPPTGHGARIYPDGSIVLADLRWPTLPGRQVDLPVEYNGHCYGRFVLLPSPGTAVSRERRLVASTLANEVGAILAAGGGRARSGG
jgi:hypothetical protein